MSARNSLGGLGMYSTLREVFRSFRCDDRGNVFVLFGAMAIPLLLIMGGAVDFARYTRYRTDLSNAVDAAALALSRQHPEYTAAQAKTFMQQYIEAMNLGNSQFTVASYDAVKLDHGFTVTVNGSMRTIFLPLGGFAKNGSPINSMDVNITAQALANRLELAMVLDVTGSMNCGATVSSSCSTNWSAPASDSRIVALRSAATTLVNTLMTVENNDPSRIMVGVVPFEGTVNIGSTYAASPPSWVDWSNTGQAYWNGRNFTGINSSGASCTLGTTGCNRIGHKQLFTWLAQDTTKPISWAGCVEARNAPYDVQDTTPTTATPDTLFVPFFWPDEPDRYNTSSTGEPYQYTTSSTSPSGADTRYNSNFNTSSPTSTSSSDNYTFLNNYLSDKVAQAASATRPVLVQQSWAKYKYTSSTNKEIWLTSPSTSNQYTAATTFPYSAGPNRGCPQAMVPLTSTRSTVTNLLSNLVAYGAMGTYIPIGLVWGWHMLTKNEPLTQGVGPADADWGVTKKALILFTDGDNATTAVSNNPNNSYFSAWGYLAANRLGTTSSASTANSTLDSKTSTLCTNIKQNGTAADTSDDIRLYVVTFGTITTSTTTLMTNCATVIAGDPLYYHAPTTSDIADVFQKIAADLTNLRLAM